MRRDLWGLNVAFTVLSLCSGVGGLELGIKTAKPNARVLAYLEREAFAAAVLLARMEDACLEPAPIWCGDLAQCDFDPFVGEVDCIAAGFPCQPFSVAGKQKGIEDERWIFNDIANAIRKVRPRRYVFLENVPGIVASGIGHVLRSLSEVGFSNVAWGSIRASTVGASHRRDRIFILAKSDEFTESSGTLDNANNANGRPGKPGKQKQARKRRRESSKPIANLANAHNNGSSNVERCGEGCNRSRATGKTRRRCECLANAGGTSQRRGKPGQVVGAEEAPRIQKRERDQSGLAVDGSNEGMGIFAPGPNDPRWPEFIAADPSIEPALCKLDDGMADRMVRLRAAGNGVCSLQAAVAFHVLENRLREYAR